ncbi:MAG: hypothetical protein ACRCZP_13090 [Phycicoccus sp.]
MNWLNIGQGLAVYQLRTLRQVARSQALEIGALRERVHPGCALQGGGA